MKKLTEGWVKFHRAIRNWRWYDDLQVRILFMHLLITVQYEEYEYKNIILKPGQRTFGREDLAGECGLSEQQTRTALKKLKSTGEITIESTNQGSVLTIVNWEVFQKDDEKPTSKKTNEITSEQPASNQQATTNKEEQELKEKGESRAYTREDSPPPDDKNFKISGGYATNLIKREEKGEKLTEQEMDLLKRYKRREGWIDPAPKTPPLPLDPWRRGRTLLLERHRKLARGDPRPMLSAEDEKAVMEYEEYLKNNNMELIDGIPQEILQKTA